jgi:hypothetical protein
MDISSTILTDIKIHGYPYGCNYGEIKDFLTSKTDFIRRQQKAIEIVDGIMTMHGKQELRSHVSELAKVEHGIRELQPWVRDHVVHALLSFLLGIYLNENLLRLIIGMPVNEFQWKLAGLFHDIAYPVQIAKDILKPYTKRINDIKLRLGVPAPDVQFRVVPIGLDRLTTGIDSFELLQKCIDTWGLQINARVEFDNMVQRADICHGMISSLTLLYVIDLMYHKFNPKRLYEDVEMDRTNISWNQCYFEDDVVPACAAIFVHNLPARCFAEARIDPIRAPLAYLLKLSDSLQEWDRPSLDNPNGLPSSAFDIGADETAILFHVSIPAVLRKIQNEMDTVIITNNVQIRG